MGRCPGVSREWLPTPVSSPGESHGQRSLAGYSPQGHKESDVTNYTFTFRRDRAPLEDWRTGKNPDRGVASGKSNRKQGDRSERHFSPSTLFAPFDWFHVSLATLKPKGFPGDWVVFREAVVLKVGSPGQPQGTQELVRSTNSWASSQTSRTPTFCGAGLICPGDSRAGA